MGNKVLNFLVKAVGTVVLFFIGYLVLQYFDNGIVDYTKAVRFALIYGMVLVVGREIFDYFRRKKQ
jgi:uncharacterized membrane protein YbhN (UPF0104 family)